MKATCGYWLAMKVPDDGLELAKINHIAPWKAESLYRQIESGATPVIDIPDRRPFVTPVGPIDRTRIVPGSDPVEEARLRAELERARASAPGPFGE